MTPIIHSALYTGFRTTLDQFSNHFFELKIDRTSLIHYSLTASITTSVAILALMELTKTSISNICENNSLPRQILYLTAAIGSTLACRTIGNITGKRTTEFISKKPISAHQIEQLNASILGLGLSSAITIASLASNYLFFLELKKHLH